MKRPLFGPIGAVDDRPPRARPAPDRARWARHQGGVDTLLEDNRAALYGLMLDASLLLRSDRKDESTTLWRRLDKRTFEAEIEQEKETVAAKKLSP